MNFVKLHKNTSESALAVTTEIVEVWINFDHVVRMDPHGGGTHIDFTDAGLEEVVVESIEQITKEFYKT